MSLLSFAGYFDLADTFEVAATLKISRDKLFENVYRQCLANQPTTQNQNVGVIVAARQLSFERTVAQSRSDTVMTVGCNRNAYARTAGKQPKRAWVSHNTGSNGMSIIRVVT